MKTVMMTIMLLMFAGPIAHAEQGKKTQEVNFEGSDVDGQKHNPYVSDVLQKRGTKFLPLYKVRDRFDVSIKDSVEYIK